MTIYGLLNFYDHYLKTQNNCSDPVKVCFSAALAEKVEDIDTFWKSQGFVAQRRAEMLKNAGNNHVKNSQYKEAIRLYQRAIEIKPDYVDAYYNLAKSYKALGDIPNSISSYVKLLEITPNDVESLSYLGECYKETGKLSEAKDYYNKALKIDPKFDLADRQLKEVENLKLAQTNPELAKQKEFQFADANLKQALVLVAKYLPEEMNSDLHDVKFVFDTTNSLSGQANIAQYENNKRRVVVTSKYIWAAPEVIATYIIHETIHADDRDSYTSITEEQDAYRESVKFWIANNNGIKDPEMDFAASLYLISPEKLNAKVAEVYSSRDKSIPQNSPNHGISAFSLKSGMFAVRGLFDRILSKDPGLRQDKISGNQGLLSYYCK